MALTCKSLLGLTAFNEIQLVAGQNGLEKPITWPYVKQTESLKGWINGGEILFVVEKNRDKGENFFAELMDECEMLKVSAVIFFCKGEEYVEHIPSCVCRLAEQYAIPVFEMPSDIRMIDVTREISNTIFLWNYQNKQAENFLMELLHEDYLTGNQRISDGTYYGFNLDKSSFVAVFCDKNMIDDGRNNLFTIQNRFSLVSMGIAMECEKYGEKYISTFSCGTLICYFSSEDKEKRKLLKKKINHLLEEQNRSNTSRILVGYSKLYPGINHMPAAYEEARQALRYAMKNMDGGVSCTYEEMGILRFLLAQKRKDELLDYCNEVLYELKEIDKKENSEYVRTLWLYLKMNNNLVKTAQIMYIHRNTLVNRINKIQAIIGKDINDVKVKMEYLNVFSILEFYGLMGE